MNPDNRFPAPSKGATPPRRLLRFGDWTFLALAIAATLLVVGVMVTLVVGPLYGSRFTIQSLGFSFLYGTTVESNNNVDGFLPFL